MADDKSPTNKIVNAPLRKESTTRGSIRQALGSPLQATTESLLSRDDVREIIQEVMKAELSLMLSKFNETVNAILNRELRPINAKIAAMDDKIKLLNSQYEHLLKEHATSKETIEDLQKENSDTKNNINSLKVRLDQLEQTQSKNVEIQCLPEKKQENLLKIVSELSKLVGCVVENRDLLHCTRVAKLNPDNTGPRSIVVQLAFPRVREKFLASTINFNKNIKENKLDSTHLSYSGPKPAIYVTEYLSPTYMALHAAARIKARELGYKFVWIRGGRIFVRKVQESEHIMVKNMDTLNKLI